MEAGLDLHDAAVQRLELYMSGSGSTVRLAVCTDFYVPKPTLALQSGMINFVDMNSISPLAAPAHILALQASIDHLISQRNALECLVACIQAERERLEGTVGSSAGLSRSRNL